MTEDEAKAKWCPFARRHPVMPYNGPVSNGLGYSTNAPPVDREAHCIASACMAWRQVETEETTTTLYEHEAAPGRAWEKVGDSWDADPHKLLSSEQRLQRWRRPEALGHGFCGLAGKP